MRTSEDYNRTWTKSFEFFSWNVVVGRSSAIFKISSSFHILCARRCVQWIIWNVKLELQLSQNALKTLSSSRVHCRLRPFMMTTWRQSRCLHCVVVTDQSVTVIFWCLVHFFLVDLDIISALLATGLPAQLKVISELWKVKWVEN